MKNVSKEKIREYSIKQYGITVEQYNQMFVDQNGLCKICKNPKGSNEKNLSIDHCHTTGKVRGLLCNKCNAGLGFFKDDISILTEAIKYLS